MCGYIGKISSAAINPLSIEENNKRIICRGPDETKKFYGKFQDLFINDDLLNFNFTFNRLAILDLSTSASQPMINKDQNTILMFNGEIYNHSVLRKDLEKDGIKFISDHSDSEVVLNGLTYYGNSFVDKLIGQFSIAFYRSNSRNLTLIRDRVGQKPLFFANTQSDIVFGSNLTSVSNEFNSKKINKNSYIEFINYGVVPSPNTIYENVYKLKPGQILSFDLNKNSINSKSKIYWDPKEKTNELDFDENTFNNLVSDAIAIREEADVPVANFLSGGIDSTFIIKNMNDRNKQINSFSVVLKDKKYDERKWSNMVVNKYGTNHTEYELSSTDLDEFVFDSVKLFDEPYADPSTVPSYIITKLMSQAYKTSISGDGGDELIGGYVRTQSLLKKRNIFRNQFKYINSIYPKHLGSGNKFVRNSSSLMEAASSFFSDKNLLLHFGIEDTFTFENNYFNNTGTTYKTLLGIEYSFFLSEMMMLKVDRTSMANSLEVRSPFVDHRLIEYVFSTKPNYLEKDNQKKLFKDYLSEDFNEEFLNRPKQGFVFNLEKWVYQNKAMVYEVITSNDIFRIFDEKKLDKLFKNISRINGLRIWRLFVLSNHIKSST